MIEKLIERDVKKKVKRIIDKYTQLDRCVFWSYWPVQTGFGKHGIPDCLLCLQGQLVAIETKVDGKQPTGRQWYEMAEMYAARAIVLVIDQHNLADIEHVFNAIKGGNVNEAARRAYHSIEDYKKRGL